MYWSWGKSVGGWLEGVEPETGLSAVESGEVCEWAIFNERGDCSIVPQVMSHPPRKREDRQEQGWRAFRWRWAGRSCVIFGWEFRIRLAIDVSVLSVKIQISTPTRLYNEAFESGHYGSMKP